MTQNTQNNKQTCQRQVATCYIAVHSSSWQMSQALRILRRHTSYDYKTYASFTSKFLTCSNLWPFEQKIGLMTKHSLQLWSSICILVLKFRPCLDKQINRRPKHVMWSIRQPYNTVMWHIGWPHNYTGKQHSDVTGWWVIISIIRVVLLQLP